MRRVFAVAVVIPLGLVVPRANAQPVDSPQLSPHQAQPVESSGEVVLTLSKRTPGRIIYRSVDGSCTDPYSGQTRSYCLPTARAPEDYHAVSGEVVFTAAGSRRIVVPIVNDNLAEGYEAFEVQAHELEDTNGWAGGSFAIVRINDDDEGDGNPRGEVTSTTTTTRGGAPGAVPAPTLPLRAPLARLSAPPTTAAPPARDLEIALSADELRPGSGFELPDADSLPPGVNGGRRRGGPTAGLAFGLGNAALGVGVGAWVHRRRRWSPNRA